jgi:rhodanese-related sulfurtransferase
MARDEFIIEVTDGLLPPPQYFAKNASLNKMGYESIDEVMKRGANPLSPREFDVVANSTGALVLDVRPKEEFVRGFIPNSIYIGLDGSFAPWVGALIPDLQQELLIVAPPGREKETVMRLARVGYDNALGFLEGGFEAWRSAGLDFETIETIDVQELEKRYTADPSISILDVRKPGEWSAEHIDGARHFPLDFINNHMTDVQREMTYFLHCRSGYRSTIAASILKARGFDKLVNVHGKFDQIVKSQLPVTDFVCASTTVAK